MFYFARIASSPSRCGYHRRRTRRVIPYWVPGTNQRKQTAQRPTMLIVSERRLV